MEENENIEDENLDNTPQLTIEELVEKRLAEKQANKLFKDSDNRVRGSAKEKRAYKIISLKNLDEIEEDETFAREMIVKNKVYPKIDVEKEREQGVSGGAAYLKKELRKAILDAPANNVLYRKIYVGYINYLLDEMENIYFVKDFKDWVKNNYPSSLLLNLVNILNPELAAQNISILELKEAEIAQKESEQKVWSDMKSSLEEELKEKYPDAIEVRYYNVVPKDNLPVYLKEKYEKLQAQIADLSIEIYALGKNKLDHIRKWWEVSEIKDINIFSERRLINLFGEIFGIGFDNFLTNNTKLTQAKYLLAESYESFTEEESEIAMSTPSVLVYKSNRDRLIIDIETAKNLKYIEDYDNFYKRKLDEPYKIPSGKNNRLYSYDNRQIWRFGSGLFKNFQGKWFGYENYRDLEDLEIYNKRWISSIEKILEFFQKEYAVVEERYKVREDNWEWAKSKPKGPAKEIDEGVVNYKIKANVYPPLAHIKRTGGVKITEEDITVESVENKFGFRTVQFGLTLKDSEAKEHIRHFISACADLSEILNFDISFLNKLGGLSIGFAARGHGRAAAHYESSKKIINITRTRGGGAVAHEYMHYIDNIIPKFDRPDYDYEDWASDLRISYNGRLYAEKVVMDSVGNAIENIFMYIYNRKLPNGNESDGGEIKIYVNANDLEFPDLPKSFRFYNEEEKTPTDIDEYLTLFRKRYSTITNIEDLKKKEWDMLGAIVKKFGHKQYLISFKTYKSAFYANSIGMDSDYWTRPEELFARSFECYVFDKLQKAGRENNYLVSGVYFEHPLGIYPQGEERIELFNLYEEFIKVIKKAYDIPDFKPWTTERVDEFIEIQDEKKGKGTKGIIVDSESGKVVDSIGLPVKLSKKQKAAKKKLVKLLSLLKIQKKEKGGNIDDNNNFLEKLNKFALNL